ncbi:MAG: hypothetical protein LBI63_01850 [Candidatus Ancillula sp.]|jgi:hypothetical protein|nr:hypothetical protein [Candidatus Ancillula sp.]
MMDNEELCVEAAQTLEKALLKASKMLDETGNYREFCGVLSAFLQILEYKHDQEQAALKQNGDELDELFLQRNKSKKPGGRGK